MHLYITFFYSGFWNWTWTVNLDLAHCYWVTSKIVFSPNHPNDLCLVSSDIFMPWTQANLDQNSLSNMNYVACVVMVHGCKMCNYDLQTLQHYMIRDHSAYGLSQWETTLQCKVVSQWLGPSAEWSLMIIVKRLMKPWSGFIGSVKYL